jgi:hypothetical protein
MKFSKWLENRETLRTNNKKILLVLRGPSGSGKSTKAKVLLAKYGGNPDRHIISTDNQWIPETLAKRRNGEFVSDEEETKEYIRNFDKDKLTAAHANTLVKFKEAVDQGITPLIADNTFCSISEIRPYADYAEQRGYEVKMEYPNSPWWKELAPALGNKKANQDQIIKSANELQKRQKHGVPFESILSMLDRWDHNPTMADILGREPTKSR